MDRIQYAVYTDKSIRLLGKINILLISNLDQLEEKSSIGSKSSLVLR